MNTKEFPVTQQLNDGIRVLQGQAHLVNGTLYFCHTSCDLLNEGTVEDYLRQVTAWIRTHPFDVVTIIFGNYNWADKDADGNPQLNMIKYLDTFPFRYYLIVRDVQELPGVLAGALRQWFAEVVESGA